MKANDLAKRLAELPFYTYRMNKGYFYGPGAGSALEGKPVDWKLSNPRPESRVSAVSAKEKQ